MSTAAVIFDLDNTLINRKMAFKKFAERFIDRYLVIDDALDRMKTINMMIEADQDGYRSKKEFYQELIESFTWQKDVSIEELLDYWSSHFFTCTTVMDGAFETIQAIKHKGMKLGIITNGSIHVQHAKIDQAGFRAYFDSVLVSDEVKLKKPDKRIFELSLNQLNIKADQAIFVGDHPINDVEGANQAGLTGIWLKGFRDWESSLKKPKYVIKNLKDVLKIIKSH